MDAGSTKALRLQLIFMTGCDRALVADRRIVYSTQHEQGPFREWCTCSGAPQKLNTTSVLDVLRMTSSAPLAGSTVSCLLLIVTAGLPHRLTVRSAACCRMQATCSRFWACSVKTRSPLR